MHKECFFLYVMETGSISWNPNNLPDVLMASVFPVYFLFFCLIALNI